jgi:hypothetical protein
MVMDENTARAIDTRLAALYADLSKAQSVHGAKLDALHYMVRDRREYHGRTPIWQLSHPAATAKAAQLVAEGKDDDLSIGRGKLAATLTTIADAHDTVEFISGQMEEFDIIYRADPWTRYFPCMNSNGHIHRSLTGCRTVRWDTMMGWTPELSGKPVEAAIAELGPALCTVCYPDAPVEWTAKTLGQIEKERTAAERAAAKAERDAAKAVKNLTPDQQFRDHRNDRVTTVAAAKQVLRDEVELRGGHNRDPHPWHADAVKAAAKAREVLLARGTDPAELDRIVASTEKRMARAA